MSERKTVKQPLWLLIVKSLGAFVAMCALSWPFFLVPATLLNAMFSNAWNAGVLALYPAAIFAIACTGIGIAERFDFESNQTKKVLPPYEGFPTHSVILSVSYVLICICIQYCIYLLLKGHSPSLLPFAYGLFTTCECEIALKFLTKKGRKKMFGREAELRNRSNADLYQNAISKASIKRDPKW